AGLHPGKRASEPWVDAVVAGPPIDLSADLRLCAQPRQPTARPPESRDRLGAGEAVGLEPSAALNSEDGCLRDPPEDSVERHKDPVSTQQELELGNVPAL